MRKGEEERGEEETRTEYINKENLNIFILIRTMRKTLTVFFKDVSCQIFYSSNRGLLNASLVCSHPQLYIQEEALNLSLNVFQTSPQLLRSLMATEKFLFQPKMLVPMEGTRLVHFLFLLQTPLGRLIPRFEIMVGE